MAAPNTDSITIDLSVRQRCAAELAQRRARLNPAGRPHPDNSAAVAALRRSLKQATEPERARLETMLANLLATYRPDKIAPPKPLLLPKPQPQPRRLHSRNETMRAMCARLLQATDSEGMGLPYAEIRRRAVKAFPVVLFGRYRGRPSKCNMSELERIAGELRAAGIVLPNRPHGHSVNRRNRANTAARGHARQRPSVADCAA